MQRYKLLALVLATMLMLAPQPGTAQDEPFVVYFWSDDAVTLYGVDVTQIGAITELSLAGRLVPDPRLAVSPDGTLLAHCFQDLNAAADTIVVQTIDIRSGAVVNERNLGAGVDCGLWPGSWSDDSQQVVVGIERFSLLSVWYGEETAEGRGPALDVVILSRDLQQDVYTTMDAAIDISGGLWTGIGRVVYDPDRSVYLQTFTFEGYGAVQWDLQAGTATIVDGGLANVQRLAGSGAVVYAAADPAYYQRLVTGLGDVPLNVLKLRQADGTVRDIHSLGDTINDTLYPPTFVGNGQALLINRDTINYLLFRDGSVRDVNDVNTTGQIIGTPQGYLVVKRRASAYTVNHFNLEGQARGQLLTLRDAAGTTARFVGGQRLVAGDDLPPFSTALDAQTAATALAVTCADVDPPPQLTPGLATLVGSVPVNLWAWPGRAAEPITEIVASDTVQILSGPYCADGLAWYEMMLVSGPRGWAIEGADGAYWFAAAP